MQRKRADIMKRLKARIVALEAADTLGDLPADDPKGRWHQLHGNYDGCWAGDLSGNWRLIVDPHPHGELSATVVTVIELKDYH